jgi:hypothetical protein
MKIGLFELELNGVKLVSLGSKQPPSSEAPWMIAGLRVPSILLPFYKRNELGEWERTLAVSFPTLFQITNVSDISWELHIRLLGFGCSLIIQYGY